MVFTRAVIKIIFFDSSLTRIVRVALVSFVLRSCRTRVARVWHSCCKFDWIVIKLS